MAKDDWLYGNPPIRENNQSQKNRGMQRKDKHSKSGDKGMHLSMKQKQNGI